MCKEIGVEDPEQWLEQCPERVFENWQTYNKLEPIGISAESIARITALLYVIAIKESDFETVQKLVEKMTPWFMPSDWVGQPKPVDVDESLRSVEAQMARMYS